MRDPRKKLAKLSRRQRRAMLAVIIIAASPALADEPANVSARMMPPLPLHSIVEQQVQDNPFFEPAPTAKPGPRVRLASSGETSTIRLKPIGAAIGLQSIERNQPTIASQPAMTIQSVAAPEVRNNPLVGSSHRVNNELIETEVVDQAVTTMTPVPQTAANAAPTTLRSTGPSATEKNSFEVDKSPADQDATDQDATSGSSIILIPPAPGPSAVAEINTTLLIPPLSQNESASTVETPAEIPTHPVVVAPPVAAYSNATRPVTPEPVAAEPVTPQPVATQPVATQPVATQPVATQPAAATSVPAITMVEEADPVLFSLSDRSDDGGQSGDTNDSSATELPEFETTASASSSASVSPQEVIDTDAAPQPTELAEAGETDFRVDEPSETESVESHWNRSEIGMAKPIVLDDSVFASSSLKPMESVISDENDSPVAIYLSESSVLKEVELPEATLHTKRYRPPVAVKPVPIAFERTGEEQSIVKSAVQSAISPNFEGLNPDVASKFTPLYLSRAQVRSLTLGGEVRGVKVADKSICQAFASGPNQLKLVGTGNGVTRLVVWADSDDADEPTRMRAFEVHVKDAVETTGEQIGDKAAVLSQTIREAFPNSSVTVRHYRDQLVVAGHCDSEASAKKIIRIVRKTCLVPVRDELVVRY